MPPKTATTSTVTPYEVLVRRQRALHDYLESARADAATHVPVERVADLLGVNLSPSAVR